MTQPVHVIYGGAHLFRADTCRKLSTLAQRALADHAPDSAAFASVLGLPVELAPKVYARVAEKLGTEAVEDYRVDFEDGFGVRSEQEEDATARFAGEQAASAALPRSFGIRVKALNAASGARALRTLDLFLGALGGRVPQNFVVSLPKIVALEEVRTLADALQAYPGAGIELMIETPQALRRLPELVEAGQGRVTAAHFGAYDYAASLGITSAHLLHPACDFARSTMQLALADTGVWLCDGATNILPIGDRAAIHRAWKLHYDHVRHALDCGFYQGWDLHPAQLPARFAAVFAFFLERADEAAARLRNFVEQSRRATEVGGIFDDAATIRGLVAFFRRAVSCGAIPQSEAPPYPEGF